MSCRIFSRMLFILIVMNNGLYSSAITDFSLIRGNDQPVDNILNVPAGFGTTHFITGFPHSTVQHRPSRYQKQESTAVSEKTVLFSPDDNLQHALIALINNEHKSIKVAIYTFTDKDIAQALIDAHKRGVRVQVVADPSQLKDRYSKCSLLQEEGIKVFEYDPNYVKDMRSNLMHHKFAIFGCEPYQDCCVWTGSFNFTHAACKRNQENAIIVKDVHSVKRFSDQFEVLKQRCRSSK